MRLTWVVLIAMARLARAESIDEEKSWKDYKDQLDKAVEETNKTCGTKLKVTYDPKAEETPRPPGRDYGNGATYCVNELDGIRSVCGDDVGKKHVQKKLKGVVCKFKSGSSAKQPMGGPKLELKSGKLTMTFDWNTANISTVVSELLTKKL